MGGKTSVDLALLYPDRVRALVLIGPAISGAPDVEVEAGVKPLEAALIAADEAGDVDELTGSRLTSGSTARWCRRAGSGERRARCSWR